MQNTFHGDSVEQRQHPVYDGGYLETPYTVNRPLPSNAAPTTNSDPQWATSRGYQDHSLGFGCGFPPSSGVRGLEGFGLPPPYAFNPSVPPPSFGCTTPVPFPVNNYSSFGAPPPTLNQYFGPAPQSKQYNSQLIPRQQECGDSSCHRGIADDWNQGTNKDETAVQRKQDERWLKYFIKNKSKLSKGPKQPAQTSVPELREVLCRAAQVVSMLSESCETLKLSLENREVWTDTYKTASSLKTEVHNKLSFLTERECLDSLKVTLSPITRRRARRLRCRKLVQMEDKQRETLIAEKEADIDKWRMKHIHQVEEKKKEQELKLAADTVLCEVRKKQADVKRMQEALRSLEKLRKLRKEAALRKGIFTDQGSEEAFNSQLERLRSMMKKRTVTYSAEEKALMVMLEGVQEEERRRDIEKKLKEERERQLQRKHKVDTMLFGDEIPAEPVLQPFREYYTQARHSLHTLLQIRREWDVCLVAAYHPDGTAVPQNWVLPDVPSDQAWASALLSADPQSDSH